MKNIKGYLIALSLVAVAMCFGTAALASCGTASWYGYTGHRTANGEIHPKADLTAAHPTAAFGTVFLVQRPDIRATVAVRINDRGPFVRGRIIDLSPAAARQIGMGPRGDGLARVCISRIERDRLRRTS